MIYSVHYLRGIAALLVAGFHIRFTLNDVYAQKDIGQIFFLNGRVGVDLFFLISGFIIVASTARINDANAKNFVIRRLLRVYPLLIACVIGIFMIPHYREGLGTIDLIIKFFKSIIPLHRDYNAQAPFFNYNPLGPAWTLTYEIYFYAVFTIALVISHRYRILIAGILMLCLIFGLQLYFNGKLYLNSYERLNFPVTNSFNGILQVFGSPMNVEFVIGMLIGKLYFSKDRIPPEYSARFWNLALWILGTFSCALYLSSNYFQEGPTSFGVLALMFFIPALWNEKYKPITKPNRFFVFFGDISYSLYLSQAIVLEGFFLTNGSRIPFYEHAQGISRFLFVLTAMILTATVFHYLIEKPSIKLARKLTSRGNVRVAAPDTLKPAR